MPEATLQATDHAAQRVESQSRTEAGAVRVAGRDLPPHSPGRMAGSSSVSARVHCPSSTAFSPLPTPSLIRPCGRVALGVSPLCLSAPASSLLPPSSLTGALSRAPLSVDLHSLCHSGPLPTPSINGPRGVPTVSFCLRPASSHRRSLAGPRGRAALIVGSRPLCRSVPASKSACLQHALTHAYPWAAASRPAAGRRWLAVWGRTNDERGVASYTSPSHGRHVGACARVVWRSKES